MDLVLMIELKSFQQTIDLIFQIQPCQDQVDWVERLNSYYQIKKLNHIDEFNSAYLKAVCVVADVIALNRRGKFLIHQDFVEGIAVEQAKKKSNLNYCA